MIASYVLVLACLAGYGLHLARERKALRKSLSTGRIPNRGGQMEAARSISM